MLFSVLESDLLKVSMCKKMCVNLQICKSPFSMFAIQSVFNIVFNLKYSAKKKKSMLVHQGAKL